jgi:DNA-binding winged helix-turn-helix (wHTH) protein/tetratricopeptide (TPR) repeat protein
MLYVFADCLLDTRRYVLCRAGRCYRLRPKVFQVLTYLLTHRDRVIPKQELCEHVWVAQAVSDATIENCIKAVRQVIGDDGRAQRLIRTLYGHGYCFVAPVAISPEAPPALPALDEMLRVPVPVPTFRQVLTQEAASAMLARPRQQYHQQMVQVLTEQFPETAEYQPELLAYHYTAAGLSEPAIVYWQRAGQHAVYRAAHGEALAHFTKGLELLHTLPVTPARARQELTLQCSLGVQLGTEGAATPEVEYAYARALELCQQVEETSALLPVLYGLSRLCKKRGELRRACELGEQFLTLAQRQHDPALLLCGHYAVGDALLWRGEFTAARMHLEQGISAYEPQRHHPHDYLYESDPWLACVGALSMTLWFLGYPDQALQRSTEALTHAQALSHPYTLARTLGYVTGLYWLRRDWQLLQERAELLRTLAAKQGFTELLALATKRCGLALIGQGQAAAGFPQIQQSMATLLALRTEERRATLLTQLAMMHGQVGQPEEGLRLLAEAMAARQITEERLDEVGRYRLKGELLLMLPQPDARQAEDCFYRALAIARQQRAKSSELRTALCLSRLWQQQGKRAEARQLLAEIYHWFTEGFASVDLQETRMLLEALG